MNSTSTNSSTATANGSQTRGKRSPCGCAEQTPSQPCCCDLVCFDRPNYFCGHLLTDADLTLQQKYVIEKNKLYHRTMAGHGIVCGLKLTCDCDCKGNILIHDGFAIDDCGNDLVVCETTRFDVIAALRAKGLLFYEEPGDDCEPRRRQPHCDFRQCYYITVCYDETESEYETPFQSSCTSGPKQCMPTRVHEGVRFDVTEHLPPKHSYLAGLEERIRECFEINCNSPIGVRLKQHARDIGMILGKDTGDLVRHPCELFCELRAYFLNYLKMHPPQFQCNLFEEVSCLACPECNDDRKWRRPMEWEQRCREEMQEAYRRLLYYMQSYQYDCVFGDLVFSCQQPCEAHCIVLGTVEVVNGKLVRVCNTPRQYLWAPANLQQVLTYELLTGLEVPGRAGSDKVPCCPDYPHFDPLCFLAELELDQCGRFHAAAALPRSLAAAAEALHAAFDFTDSCAVPPSIFERVPHDRLTEAAALFGLAASAEQIHTSELSKLTPLQALMSHALLRPNDALVAYHAGAESGNVSPDFLAQTIRNRTLAKAIENAPHQAEHTAQQIAHLQQEIEMLKETLEEIKHRGKK